MLKKALASVAVGTIISASAFFGATTVAQAEETTCRSYVFKTIRIGNTIEVVRRVVFEQNCVPNKTVPKPIHPTPNAAIFAATTAEAKQPIKPKGNLVVCGAVKVGKFFKIIECNPNA